MDETKTEDEVPQGTSEPPMEPSSPEDAFFPKDGVSYKEAKFFAYKEMATALNRPEMMRYDYRLDEEGEVAYLNGLSMDIHDKPLQGWFFTLLMAAKNKSAFIEVNGKKWILEAGNRNRENGCTEHERTTFQKRDLKVLPDDAPEDSFKISYHLFERMINTVARFLMGKELRFNHFLDPSKKTRMEVFYNDILEEAVRRAKEEGIAFEVDETSEDIHFVKIKIPELDH